MADGGSGDVAIMEEREREGGLGTVSSRVGFVVVGRGVLVVVGSRAAPREYQEASKTHGKEEKKGKCRGLGSLRWGWGGNWLGREGEESGFFFVCGLGSWAESWPF